jgi:single-strand DNA-binding protein
MEVRKMSLNRATIIGHLGQDPELRYLPTSGQPVTGFSVATDESFTDKDGQRQERTDWHQVVVYGKAAENCHKYLTKGREVYVEGRLRTREYEARDNGGKRRRTEIIASRVQFLGVPPTDAKAAEVNGEPGSEEAPL